MKKQELLNIVENLNKIYVGEEVSLVEFDRDMQMKLKTKESLINKEFNCLRTHYTVKLEDGEDFWVTVNFEVTFDGAGINDMEILINKIL